MSEQGSESNGGVISKGRKVGKPTSRKRKWLFIALGTLLLVLLIGLPLGYQGWKYKTTNPKFCVSCHVMNDAYERWRVSEHQDVICQTCHLSTVFDIMPMSGLCRSASSGAVIVGLFARRGRHNPNPGQSPPDRRHGLNREERPV